MIFRLFQSNISNCKNRKTFNEDLSTKFVVGKTGINFELPGEINRKWKWVIVSREEKKK